MAWAPVTALFLGKISRGLTVRQFLLFNWVLPSIFGLFWMSIFSNAAIQTHLSGKANLISLIDTAGPESIIYYLIDQMPFASIIVVLFFVSVFISYVTAADSNTEAMGSLSVKGINKDDSDSPTYIKITWGVLIGSISLTMILYSGIDGIKILSNLGGLPSMFLIGVICIGVVRWMITKINL